jgi:hypothetical protein
VLVGVAFVNSSLPEALRAYLDVGSKKRGAYLNVSKDIFVSAYIICIVVI